MEVVEIAQHIDLGADYVLAFSREIRVNFTTA